MDDNDCKVAHSLVSYPSGRAVRDSTAKAAAAARARIMASSQADVVLGEFDLICPAELASGLNEWKKIGEAWKASYARLGSLIPAGSSPAEELLKRLGISTHKVWALNAPLYDCTFAMSAQSCDRCARTAIAICERCCVRSVRAVSVICGSARLA